MELSTVTNRDLKALEVTFNREVLKFTYNPNVMTPLFIRKLKDNDGNDIDSLGRFIVQAVTSWDLTNEGQPMPLNEETCALLPIALLNAIITKCNEDLAPTGKSARSSQRSATGSAGEKSFGAWEDQLTFE